MNELDTHKPLGSQGCRGSCLMASRGHSSVLESSWQLGKVPEDWKRANVTPVKRGGKENRNYSQSASIPSLGRDGATDPGSHFQVSEGQKGHEEEPTWIYEGKSYMTKASVLSCQAQGTAGHRCGRCQCLL